MGCRRCSTWRHSASNQQELMAGTDEILNQISRRTSLLNKVVAVFGPIAIAIGGVLWYFNNVWRPKVNLVTVDYEKQTATLNINGKDRVLYAGSTISAGFGWGVRFGNSSYMNDNYDRVELVKNDLVYKTLNIKEA